MFRVCDVDALMIPGQAVYYVIKLDENKEPIIIDEPLCESSHRLIDDIIIHDFFDEELNLPVLSYSVKDTICFDPPGFIAIPLTEFMDAVQYDTDTTSVEVHGDGNLVSAINITKDESGHVTLHIDTATMMYQIIPQ